MNEAAELLMRNLSAAAKAGRPVDIHRLLGDMTMQVVGTTAFGCVYYFTSMNPMQHVCMTAIVCACAYIYI